MGDNEAPKQKINYEILIKDLKQRLDSYKTNNIVKDYIICFRDGTHKENSFENIYDEKTVPIMTATLYGSANTINSELRTGDVQLIKIESEDYLEVIFPADKDNKILVFLDIGKQSDLEKLVSDIKAVSKSQQVSSSMPSHA